METILLFIVSFLFVKAGEHLAKAITTVGFDVILGILTKKAAGKVSQHVDELKQVDEVHAHSDSVYNINAGNLDNADNVNVGRIDDADNTNRNITEIDEPQRNQPNQSNDSPDVANQSTKPIDEISGNIKNKISSSPDKFELIYSDTEIRLLRLQPRKLINQ